jgi:hypothetical protein
VTSFFITSRPGQNVQAANTADTESGRSAVPCEPVRCLHAYPASTDGALGQRCAAIRANAAPATVQISRLSGKNTHSADVEQKKLKLLTAPGFPVKGH